MGNYNTTTQVPVISSEVDADNHRWEQVQPVDTPVTDNTVDKNLVTPPAEYALTNSLQYSSIQALFEMFGEMKASLSILNQTDNTLIPSVETVVLGNQDTGIHQMKQNQENMEIIMKRTADHFLNRQRLHQAYDKSVDCYFESYRKPRRGHIVEDDDDVLITKILRSFLEGEGFQLGHRSLEEYEYEESSDEESDGEHSDHESEHDEDAHHHELEQDEDIQHAMDHDASTRSEEGSISNCSDVSCQPGSDPSEVEFRQKLSDALFELLLVRPRFSQDKTGYTIHYQ